MGIRTLLNILLDGLGTATLRLIPPARRPFVVSRMYIDMQQYIYKAISSLEADALQADVPVMIDDDKLIARTVTLVLDVVKEISPRMFLGIYFDGIPPLAKVVEQRARRYEMEKPTAGKFDRVKITVGTAFMRSMVEGLLAGLRDNIGMLPQEIEVSTSAERGEGEHKLANRIRDRDASQPGVKVIVGDDGDIMVMALLNSWKDCYILTERKEQNLRGLLSIGGVAERVRQRLGDTPTAVYDFCLMVILTGGNDFMPTILSARIRRKALTEMMDMYDSVLKGQPLMTNQGREIVWSSVRAIINEFATNEERNLREVAMEAKKRRQDRMPSLFTRSMDPKTGEIKLPFFRKAWDDDLYEPGVPREQLPESIVIPRPTQREIDADHAYSATQYLQGLSWTLGYMRTGDGPDWYYGSPYPPLFGDMARVMVAGADPVRPLRTMPPWEPQQLAVYLLTVLPRQAAEDLFGESFVNAFSFGAGIGDLFPKRFAHFAPAEWDKTMKGRAILPPLGLDRISKVVAERLDSDVIERNLRALEPRVRFSHTQGSWVPVRGATGLGEPAEQRRTRCPAGAADYEILDVIIPSMV